MHSPPRQPRSRSLSPHHISMTTTHTCCWIPHSGISLGDMSVCLWDGIKQIRSSRFEWWQPQKNHVEVTGADFPGAQTHLMLHFSQVILASAAALKRLRAGNSANAQEETPPPLSICSLCHKVGLIQITALSLGCLVSLIRVSILDRDAEGSSTCTFHTIICFYEREHSHLCCGASAPPPHQRHLSASKCSCEQ